MKGHVRTGWTSVPNSLLVDCGLTSDGVRLIGWLISHKGNFDISRGAIISALNMGEHRLRKAIKEAKQSGYLKTVDVRCKKTGQLKSRYAVSADGRFPTSGKPTSIRTLNITSEFEKLERAFLEAFPLTSFNQEQFRIRLEEAVGFFGLEYVIEEAEHYSTEVASRRKGGRIARPENWLWRLRWGHLDDVIEDD